MRLAGAVALVTGGGAGIGEAIAHRLARDGAAVLVADLLPDPAQRVAAEITAAGLRAIAFTLDVAEEDQATAAVAEVEARFGPLRLAICNAGITDRVPALEMSRAGIVNFAVSGWNEAAGACWRDDARARHLPWLPLPSRDHQLRCLALPRLRPEPARGGAYPGRERHRRQPREHPAVVPQVRRRLCPQAPSAPAEAGRHLAP